MEMEPEAPDEPSDNVRLMPDLIGTLPRLGENLAEAKAFSAQNQNAMDGPVSNIWTALSGRSPAAGASPTKYGFNRDFDQR
jgi:hypothetical protein